MREDEHNEAPLVHGGQGRSPENVTDDAVGVSISALTAAVLLLALVGVVCLAQ